MSLRYCSPHLVIKGGMSTHAHSNLVLLLPAVLFALCILIVLQRDRSVNQRRLDALANHSRVTHKEAEELFEIQSVAGKDIGRAGVSMFNDVVAELKRVAFMQTRLHALEEATQQKLKQSDEMVVRIAQLAEEIAFSENMLKHCESMRRSHLPTTRAAPTSSNVTSYADVEATAPPALPHKVKHDKKSPLPHPTHVHVVTTAPPKKPKTPAKAPLAAATNAKTPKKAIPAKAAIPTAAVVDDEEEVAFSVTLTPAADTIESNLPASVGTKGANPKTVNPKATTSKRMRTTHAHEPLVTTSAVPPVAGKARRTHPKATKPAEEDEAASIVATSPVPPAAGKARRAHSKATRPAEENEAASIVATFPDPPAAGKARYTHPKAAKPAEEDDAAILAATSTVPPVAGKARHAHPKATTTKPAEEDEAMSTVATSIVAPVAGKARHAHPKATKPAEEDEAAILAVTSPVPPVAIKVRHTHPKAVKSAEDDDAASIVATSTVPPVAGKARHAHPKATTTKPVEENEAASIVATSAVLPVAIKVRRTHPKAATTKAPEEDEATTPAVTLAKEVLERMAKQYAQLAASLKALEQRHRGQEGASQLMPERAPGAVGGIGDPKMQQTSSEPTETLEAQTDVPLSEKRRKKLLPSAPPIVASTLPSEEPTTTPLVLQTEEPTLPKTRPLLVILSPKATATDPPEPSQSTATSTQNPGKDDTVPPKDVTEGGLPVGPAQITHHIYHYPHHRRNERHVHQ